MKLTGKNAADLFMSINGIQLCYDDYGSSETAVIFIHGFPFNKSTWDAQTSFLSQTYRVLAYDIRGFGKSDPGEEKFSINLFADDLIAFMDELGIEKAIICGLSMGGYILLNALKRYPERFNAAILCDTQCVADTNEGKEKRLKTIAQIEDGGVKEFTEGFLKAIFHEESINTKSALVNRIRNTILSAKTSSLTQTLLALAERSETCSSLEQIQIPTLILCGEQDVVTKPEQSEYLNKKIKNSIFQLIPRAGHMSNLEQADVFTRHILLFINNLK
ncbi:MAG: alpha/beta hydrolase [Bacteroidetes bacterium]|nr:MAG: alpha/beta hydrolase [Bacteroidota bacterium]